MAKLINQSDPFYRPVWRRVIIVGVIVGWLGFEFFMNSDPLWIVGVGALLAYSVWVFFITWPRGDSST